MAEAWIHLQCPECQVSWEENPQELPPPERDFQCRQCGARHPVSDFLRTTRDLEILEEFHSD